MSEQFQQQVLQMLQQLQSGQQELHEGQQQLRKDIDQLHSEMEGVKEGQELLKMAVHEIKTEIGTTYLHQAKKNALVDNEINTFYNLIANNNQDIRLIKSHLYR